MGGVRPKVGEKIMQDLPEEVKGFIFLRTFVPGFSLLTRMQKGLAIEILIADMMGEEPPEADPVTNAICTMMLPTIHEARKEYCRKKQISRENGKNGGRPKKQADDGKPAGFDETDGFSKNHNGDESSVGSGYKEDNISPPLPPSGGNARDPYSAEFELFWHAYPKKAGKDAAFRAWKAKKREKRLPPVAELIAKVEQFKSSEQWQRDGGQYIPNPATWLNQGRWMDEAEVTPAHSPAYREPQPPEMSYPDTPPEISEETRAKIAQIKANLARQRVMA